MTRVDFYILSSANPHERRMLACKLTEKARRQGLAVHIRTGSDAETEILDKLLWIFRPGSFIPHQKTTASAAERADIHVLLGPGVAPEGCRDLLINLAPELPEFFESYGRIAELVDEDPTVRAEGRKRYAAYKQLGLALETHKLAPSPP